MKQLIIKRTQIDLSKLNIKHLINLLMIKIFLLYKLLMIKRRNQKTKILIVRLHLCAKSHKLMDYKTIKIIN